MNKSEKRFLIYCLTESAAFVVLLDPVLDGLEDLISDFLFAVSRLYVPVLVLKVVAVSPALLFISLVSGGMVDVVSVFGLPSLAPPQLDKLIIMADAKNTFFILLFFCKKEINTFQNNELNINFTLLIRQIV